MRNFVCPECGGAHFGRDTKEVDGVVHTLGTVRCHDERNIGCKWRGVWTEEDPVVPRLEKLVETSLFLESGPLIARWRKEADQYMRQVDEARAKGTPSDGMLAMATALRQCAKELEESVQ